MTIDERRPTGSGTDSGSVRPAAVPIEAAKPPAPRPPGRLRRVWPPLPGGAPGRTVVAVALTAALAGWMLVLDRPGVGWLAVAAAASGSGVVASHRSTRSLAAGRRIERAAWSAGALAFVGVGTIRADGLMFTWCVLAAIVCGSIALAGGRTFRGLAAGATAIGIAAGRGASWWVRGAARAGRTGAGGTRIGRTAVISAALLVVFGTLFSTADPEFAHLLASATSWSGADAGRWVIALPLGGVVSIGVTYLASARPIFDMIRTMPPRLVRRAEWAIPLGALDLLFLSFVLVQLATLFGGRQRVLRTADLTYAQYARSGFWQLLVVAALTLVVVAVTTRVAARAAPADRAMLRALLGTLAVLTLVIVASALQRLSVYDGAYGYTRLRLAVGVIEIWLGVVFVFVIVAGIRLRAAWLPRAVAAAAATALLATAIIGPDGFIADRDVARFQRTGRIDVTYLSGLSADAIPALGRLPEPQRDCVLAPMAERLRGRADDWRSWNLGREHARTTLGYSLPSCPGRSW